MSKFGYRNEKSNFRFVMILVVLLIMCIAVAIALVMELSNDFKANNPQYNGQSTINGTENENDGDKDSNKDNNKENNSNTDGNNDSEDENDEQEELSIVDVRDRDGRLVVVIDPGHDAYHVGSEGGGVDEEIAVLTIAKYCYEELCTYKDVEVYMTRDDMVCPGGGRDTDCNAADCNVARVEYANKLSADVLVSMHLNVLGDTSFGGAIVYYPNANFIDVYNERGKELSELIMNNLVELGLKNRGVRTQDSKDNSLYPDDTLADYYGIIRGSKLSGILGIIIEHAFVSNPEDVANFLNSDAKLKELGIADARAIAEYYGLEKK